MEHTLSTQAYRHGEETARAEFGLTKTAIAPLLGAGLMAGARALGARALPWLGRTAMSAGRSALQQLPSAAAQTAVGMGMSGLQNHMGNKLPGEVG